MDKWADYGISRVRYNKERTHIEKVEVWEDKGDSLSGPEVWSRLQVVSTIDEGKTFVTVPRTGEGKWRKGEDVRVITIRGSKYIRTDRNETAKDNLGNLEEF